MPKRNAHEVLGVEPGASAASIKAAWRHLARANHPDVIGNDAAATRRATRVMAEINAAYTELSDPVRRAKSAEAARRAGRSSSASPGSGAGGGTGGAAADGVDGGDAASRNAGGRARPRPERPVTAR